MAETARINAGPALQFHMRAMQRARRMSEISSARNAAHLRPRQYARRFFTATFTRHLDNFGGVDYRNATLVVLHAISFSPAGISAPGFFMTA